MQIHRPPAPMPLFCNISILPLHVSESLTLWDLEKYSAFSQISPSAQPVFGSTHLTGLDVCIFTKSFFFFFCNTYLEIWLAALHISAWRHVSTPIFFVLIIKMLFKMPQISWIKLKCRQMKAEKLQLCWWGLFATFRTLHLSFGP